MSVRILLASVCALALSACTTTTSFAPPPVAIQYSGDKPVDFSCPFGGRSKQDVTVPRTIAGSYQLVDTFIAAIRCSAHAAANGRQVFEIPAFLATTGAATAVALGGGATYGILGTTGNAVANAGNSYWDPKQKAAIYDHALDALLCIKTEAVGIKAYSTEKPKDPKSSDPGINAMWAMAGGSVEVPVEEQYFMMVSAAAFSVERVLAQRLSNLGSVDAASVAAAIKKAAEERDKAEQAKKDPPEGTTPKADALDEAADAKTGDAKLLGKLFAAEVRKQEMAKLDLDVLKPALDECVLRAKL